MLRFLFITLWITTAMTFAQNVGSQPSPDVNELLKAFDAAWNSHNSKALSSLWLEDGDLITPWGRWIMGQGQIEKHFEQENTGPFGKSTLSQSVDAVRYLTPQLVAMDASLRINNILDPSGGSITSSLLQHAFYLLTNKENQWKILSARIYMFQQPLVD